MPNIKRLKLLAWYTLSIPREHFDMYFWFFHRMPIVNGRVEKIEDDTVGCTIGWGTQIPEFNKEGFKLSSDNLPMYEHKGNVYTNWEAVQKFFNLSEEHALNLFWSYSYEWNDLHNPAAVYNRIDQYIKKVEKQQR